MLISSLPRLSVMCTPSTHCLWAAAGSYEEVVRLEETLCSLKKQFQKLQLTDVDTDQTRQRALYKGAQKVTLSRQSPSTEPEFMTNAMLLEVSTSTSYCLVLVASVEKRKGATLRREGREKAAKRLRTLEDNLDCLQIST